MSKVASEPSVQAYQPRNPAKGPVAADVPAFKSLLDSAPAAKPPPPPPERLAAAESRREASRSKEPRSDQPPADEPARAAPADQSDSGPATAEPSQTTEAGKAEDTPADEPAADAPVDAVAAAILAAAPVAVEAVPAKPEGETPGLTAAAPLLGANAALTGGQSTAEGGDDLSGGRQDGAAGQRSHAILAAAEPKTQTPPVEPDTRHPDAASAIKSSAEAIQALGLGNGPDQGNGVTLPPAPLTGHAGAAAAATALASPAAPSLPAIPITGVAVEIAAQAQIGRSRFEIRLDPPELGRIDVRLEIDDSGQVTSRLMVDRVETLDLLRRDAAQLERALQQAGLKTADNALQFSLRDQSGGREQQRQSSQHDAQLIIADDQSPIIEAARYGRALRLGGSGLDIRV